MNPEHVYSEKFKIRSSEVSPTGKARLQAISDLLQEVAGSNALELNFDISHLNSQNLTWVLHRLHIEMDRLPEWRETITIKTWPSGGNALRAYRDFLIFDDEGNEIGRSLSYWLMMKLETRRPVRIPDDILAMATGNGNHVLPVSNNRIEPEGEPGSIQAFNIRQSDLDLNEHVNNVKYIEWALEALPKDHEVHKIDIEFKSECRYGDSVESGITETDSAENVHILRRKSDQRMVAAAISS